MIRIFAGPQQTKLRNRKVGQIIRDRWLYLMLAPGIFYFIAFKYIPMWGGVIAFKDYTPFLGMGGSEWVGLKHFDRFFGGDMFWTLMRNTLAIAFFQLLFYFPIPLILALMLNEVRKEGLKRSIQTIVYIPHFVSWVVVVGICYVFFTTEGGFVNELIASYGGEKIPFLMSEDWFRPMIILQLIWKDAGWGTIIYLAALSGISPDLYEAARMDGASRMRQLWHVTLPGISSTFVILLILHMGNFLETGFEQIFLMLNPLNNKVAEVFDTYVYVAGISQGQFSYSTAVGLFKSLVGLVLVVLANSLAKKLGQETVY